MERQIKFRGKRIKDAENTIGAMKEAGYNIKLPDRIGQLVHEPTMTAIAVYKPISRFHALMLKMCFGLKYEKV